MPAPEDTTARDWIGATNLEEMAIYSTIPQWLIYSWSSKARDKTMVDKKTQQGVAEVSVFIIFSLFM
jgi:hypothetical protein